MNEELNMQLKQVSDYSAQLSTDNGNNIVSPAVMFYSIHIFLGPSLSLPEKIRENCKEDSYDMVTKHNSGDDAFRGGSVQCVQNPRLLSLIGGLTALMLQIKRVADGERNAAELQAIKQSMTELEESLSSENVKVFQDTVFVHLQHIQQGLTQMGNLTAFM